jgi:hypothetical protein
VAHKLAVTYWVAKRTLQMLATTQRAEVVHIANGKVVWASARNAGPLRARLAAQSKANNLARQRERRTALGRAPGPRAKLYEQDDLSLDAIPDMPVVRRIHTSWPPLHAAPGPTSIFDLANHA